MSSLTHPSTPSPFNLFLLLLLLWSHWGFCFPTLSGEGLLRTPWDVFQLPLSCWVWRRPHRPETLLAPAVTPFSDASTRHWRQEQSSPDISLCVTDSSVFHFRALFLFQFFYIVGKKKKKTFETAKQVGVTPPEATWGPLHASMISWYPKIFTENPQMGKIFLTYWLHIISRYLLSRSFDCSYRITSFLWNLPSSWSLVSGNR